MASRGDTEGHRVEQMLRKAGDPPADVRSIRPRPLYTVADADGSRLPGEFVVIPLDEPDEISRAMLRAVGSIIREHDPHLARAIVDALIRAGARDRDDVIAKRERSA